MLLLLKGRVVSEDPEPLDLDGDEFRDPRLKALQLLPKVGRGSLALSGSLGFCLHPLIQKLDKNVRKEVRFQVYCLRNSVKTDQGNVS